jgi:adenine-specific DNA-methyltransferase
MIEQQRVYRIKDVDSLLGFLREALCWELPEASIDDVSFEWTGLDLNLSEDVNKKLKDGLIRQLQPFAAHQPWGIFVVEFAIREVSIITLRQILRCFVAKRRGARPDLPAWQCENLLFICVYGENGFTFAHFKGDNPYSSKLTTFSWHPGEPIRTVCEFNLPALVYDYTWTPETWVEEWQKAFDVEKVNKDFYKQIARFYYRLTGKEGQKRELVLPYVGDDSDSISIYEEFAVRLIGRSIFCWFLKHKESASHVPLIPSEALSLAAARETTDFYHSMLEPLFFEVMNKRINKRKSLAIPRSEIIPFLNGGLFEPHPNDFYVGVANYGLKIPDAWFIDFFGLLERYNFTITENSSIDVDVAVDPEMLGRIFENLLAEVVPETGETARKATGSYYTPRIIVDYMVEQALKQYLLTETELGEEKINRLVDYGEDIEDFSSEKKLTVVTALKEIKVIDPACGSGAFLMGILHRMLAVLEKVDPRLELWRAQYLRSLDGIVRQTVEKNISRENWAYIRKLMIVRDSIYGVDIQPIAVEIAKLRCFLSLVVDEIVLDNEENRGIEPLPNLEFKFVAANTLIGLPPKVEAQGAFGISDAVKKLKELRENYLRSFGAEKSRIEREFRATQQKLFKENVQWAVADTLVRQLTGWDPFSYESCGWFDPGWMFGVSDGFDVVIANPPYIDSELMTKIYSNLRNYCVNHFESAKGNWDIFIVFIEKGIQLLAVDGQITYIVPNKLLGATYAESLRKLILKQSICEIRDYSHTGVFESVNVYPIVFVIKRTEKKNSVRATLMASLNAVKTTNIVPADIFYKDIYWDCYFAEREVFDILVKCLKFPSIRSYYPEISDASTVSEAYELKKYIREYDSNQATAFKKFINTGTIDPYTSYWGVMPTQYIKASYETPIVRETDLKRMSPRRYEQACMKKVIIGGMTKRLECFYDAGEYLAGKSATIILEGGKQDLAYTTGILNSTLISFWYAKYFKSLSLAGGYLRINHNQISKIPIPDIARAGQSKLSAIVHKIVQAKNQNPDADTSGLQYQIDQMVYELYGLTAEEVAVVEESQ